MRFESFLSAALDSLDRSGLLREPDDGRERQEVAARAAELGLPLLDATSNDYLGLAQRGVSRETSGRAGAGASRLIHGTAVEHVQLETELARWVRAESALLFASTYAANLGLISALGAEGTVVISDAANHASLIDGARLAKGKAEVVVVPHLQAAAVEAAVRQASAAKACWVVTESYFSMDGDGPNLPELRRICDEHDACLIVDEAHALGVFGPRGAGRCAEVGVRPDILVGALGKAVGTHGGFVAGSNQLRRYLWNRARSFVFSTALSPAHAELSLTQVRAAQAADDARARLRANAQALRAAVAKAGLTLVRGSFGPIVSVILGDNERALTAALRLKSTGILAHAVRPPTVPVGAARLRLTVNGSMRPDEIARLASAMEAACRES